MSPSKHIRSQSPTRVTGGGPVTVVEAFVDTFSLKVIAAESNATPTDNVTYAMTLAQSDSNAGQTEAVELKFPFGVWGDSNPAPTSTLLFSLKVWLDNHTTVSGAPADIANADGENDGAVATLQTNVAGSNEEAISSDVGALVPAGVSLTAISYQGWFTSDNSLVTSSGEIWARSDDGSFTDFMMFQNQALNTNIDHSSGTFTFDLFAAGIDSSAKLSSLQIEHYVTDVAAGVSPHTMTVDAGAIVITGAFT